LIAVYCMVSSLPSIDAATDISRPEIQFGPHSVV